MGIPKGLEALVTNFVVSRCVNEEHDKKHKVASDAAGLCVVNVEGSLRANLWRELGEGEMGGVEGTYGRARH